jgi:hypothetical protein
VWKITRWSPTLIEPFSNSIRRANPAGNEFWSSRDFARVKGVGH